MPPPRKGESAKQYYTRTVNELKDIAGAIMQNAPKGAMDVQYVNLANAQKLPSPRECLSGDDKKRDYDLWLVLTYEENATFLFKVKQRDGGSFKLTDTNPEPLPDAARTRALLAEIGQRVVGRAVQAPAVSGEKLHDASRGIIFLYDKSGSMYETDRGAQNRLAVGQRIGEIVAQATQSGAQPIPFAMVVFADDAETLESKPGTKWFETNPAGLQVARARLASALKDMGNTNIEAAFKQVETLIESRKDIERWHVVFLTDGAPTAGTTDYGQITKKVTAALGGKSTLCVIALHGNDPSHTEDAKLAELVRAIMDPTGQSCEITNLKQEGDPEAFRRDVDRIAFLINRSTVRDEAALTCTYDSAANRLECENDKSQPHTLRFGAARKITFVADTTAVPGGKYTATIQNEGLGTSPRTIVLPEGQTSKSLTEPGFHIVLSRSSNHMFLNIGMTSGRMNGDWQIKLSAEATAGGKP